MASQVINSEIILIPELGGAHKHGREEKYGQFCKVLFVFKTTWLSPAITVHVYLCI